NPLDYEIWYYLKGNEEALPADMVYVPCDYRTTASERGDKEYSYWGNAGLSWSVPYMAGVIALGYQVNPHLKQDEIFQYIRETGTPFNRGVIINPGAFIKKVKEASGKG
ncbi:MAG: peptidase, partial [bacterium]|nr:peptidase [bacterium]